VEIVVVVVVDILVNTQSMCERHAKLGNQAGTKQSTTNNKTMK